MDRRTCIKQIGMGLGAIQFPWQTGIYSGSEYSDFYHEMVQANDEIISEILLRQNSKTSDLNFGGFPDKYLVYHPSSAASYMQRFAIGFCESSSKYYESQELIKVMNDGITFLLSKQHGDGTIDLLSTNFHSTPDLAFAVEPLALSYSLLLEFRHLEVTKLLQSLKQFLVAGGEALIVGGIHTPNHRWVVCSALSRLNHLFPNPRYLERINTWLDENMDIDADGQYTERSTSVYSPIVNKCLITISRLGAKKYLLDFVRKNLDMSIYLRHTNGEIATEISRRQDQYKAANYQRYFLSYLYMAHQDENGEYGAMVELIKSHLGARSLSANLAYLMEDKNLQKSYLKESLPLVYERYFPTSNLIRVADQDYDASILAENSTFFTFHKGVAVLQAVRMASAFFGKGQFVPEQLDYQKGKYILTQSWTGPYYQPHEKEAISIDGNWEEMPRHLRKQSEVQSLKATVVITKVENGFELDFNLAGTKGVPYAIELSFRKGGKWIGAKRIEQVTDSFVQNMDQATYQVDQSLITIEGFKPTHEWTQIRGAEPKIQGESLYLTGFTPLRQKIKIY